MINSTALNHFKFLKITLLRSAFGRIPKHTATLAAIGLKRIGRSVSLPNNNATRGMIHSVSHLVRVEGE